jgi:hypothetical protein
MHALRWINRNFSLSGDSRYIVYSTCVAHPDFNDTRRALLQSVSAQEGDIDFRVVATYSQLLVIGTRFADISVTFNSLVKIDTGLDAKQDRALSLIIITQRQ